MTTAANTIDLTKFCAPPELKTNRWILTSPWVEGGWRYASDGRICVRVHASGEPDSDLSRKSSGPYLFVPPFRPDEPCDVLWPRGGHCDSAGNITQEVGKAVIAGKYATLIRELPGVRCRPASSPKDPVHFIFDGGEGVVMPLAPLADIEGDKEE